MRAAEGRDIRRKKPWSKPVVHCCMNYVRGAENGGKRSYSNAVYEGSPENPYPNYSPQSVEQAS